MRSWTAGWHATIKEESQKSEVSGVRGQQEKCRGTEVRDQRSEMRNQRQKSEKTGQKMSRWVRRDD